MFIAKQIVANRSSLHRFNGSRCGSNADFFAGYAGPPNYHETLTVTMDQKRWKEFVQEIIANDRPYAGYFSWTSDRVLEEAGVIQSFYESLEHNGESFFHSYSSRGHGNDPPDYEAISNAGHRIAIEITELVDGNSIVEAKKSGHPNPTPFTKAELCAQLNERLTRKDKPSCVNGGPYQQYLLLIFCDDPRALHYDLIEHVRGFSFSRTKLIDRAFLLYSYCPWEKCCPYIALNLSGV